MAALWWRVPVLCRLEYDGAAAGLLLLLGGYWAPSCQGGAARSGPGPALQSPAPRDRGPLTFGPVTGQAPSLARQASACCSEASLRSSHSPGSPPLLHVT